MMKKQLPRKYYLTHFVECLSTLERTSKDLFDEQTLLFVNRFFMLPEDAQCLLVRFANRASQFINRYSLDYAEISDIDTQLSLLIQHKFIAPVSRSDFSLWLSALTKSELLALLDAQGIVVKRSARKPEIQKIAQSSLSFEHVPRSEHSAGIWQSYLSRSFEKQLRYLMFLYFGSVDKKLNAFSLRDLGVLTTRTDSIAQIARFNCREESLSAFTYAELLFNLEQTSSPSDYLFASETLKSERPVGAYARSKHDKVCLLMAKQVEDSAIALELLARTESPEGQEKWCRQAYKLGLKDVVKTRLESIMEEPDSESLLQFAEDFYARKYQGKRTSIPTDMLRESQRHIKVDEMFLGSVERGVQSIYRREGAECIRTENRLWRSLFGLAFWDILYEGLEAGLVSEFDRLPKVLADNSFYRVCSRSIEKRLDEMDSTDRIMRQLKRASVKYYGLPNGLFRWRTNQLEWLAKFISRVPNESVTAHLREMAKDYMHMHDGYPDVMVIENGSLRFEEIKAPGDQLRKNQQRMIKHLRSVGFTVDITTVDWFMDPQQVYAVVDIETTGGKSSNHRITEIGIAKVKSGKSIGTWQTLVNPQRHIPSNITRLTGIDNHMVRDAPIFAEVADELEKELSDCIFVAHNVNFDYGFIREEYRRLGKRFRMPKLCTVKEMRKVMPGLSSYSLANLTAHFEIAMRRHHRALSDAEAAAELLKIINDSRMAQHEPEPPSSLSYFRTTVD